MIGNFVCLKDAKAQMTAMKGNAEVRQKVEVKAIQWNGFCFLITSSNQCHIMMC